jgi:hypothetical protein
MKTLLLALSLMLGSLLGMQATKETPREYNVGLCAPDSFIALHFSVSGDSFLVTDVARGPDASHKIDPSVEFKLDSTDKDGIEHFVHNASEFDIKIDKDGIEGVLFANGDKIAVVDGVRGEAKTLAIDGQALYESCEVKRNSDPKKASN